MKKQLQLLYSAFVFLMMLLAHVAIADAQPLQIIENGLSDYVIVTGTNYPYDAFAVAEFQQILEKSTGCALKSVAPDSPEAEKATNRIFIGHCPQVHKLLGDVRIDALKKNESIVVGIDDDIVITGGGNNGTPYGVYLFLEKEIGYRYFTPYPGGERIPKHTGLMFSGTEYREYPAFDLSRRAYMLFLYDKTSRGMYQYRNRGTLRYKCVSGDVTLDGLGNSDFSLLDAGHGFHLYITTDSRKDYYEWDKSQDYFKTHPDFFSMNKDGERTDKLQLCFSNPELRKELTSRIIERGKRMGGRGVLTLGANDWPGNFCFCPKCKALQKKYGCIGGPLYDYMLEACPEVAKVLPDIKISTLAYRKAQSEVPPKGIDKMPDNWVCDFAPVDDDQGQALDGDRNIGTLKNLQAWTNITENITYWYYICINSAPFGPVERLSRDMKLMVENGVRGVGTCGMGSPGMFPMQEYIMFRLMIDPYQDVWSLVEDYNKHHYGDAAPEMTQYVKELDEIWREPKKYISLSCSGKEIMNFTPERLIRWQTMFDALEKKLFEKPNELKNLSFARWDVDMLTLLHYPKIMETFPNAGTDPDQIIERMRKVDLRSPWVYLKQKEHAEASYLTCKALSKPIPSPLNKLSSGQVIQLPQCGKKYPMKDADAACGEAQTQYFREGQIKEQNKKITFDIYDTNSKKMLQKGNIDVSTCVPGTYELYLVTKTIIPRGGLIAFDSWWGIGASLAPYYPEGDEFREFEIWASLKFVGPSFGIETEDGKDRMFCDRIFIVDRMANK